MLFLLGVAAGVAVGYAAGGRLTALAAAPFRWAWICFAAFAVQMAVVYGTVLPEWTGPVAVVLSHGALVAVALRNLRSGRLALPFALAALGLGLNFTAIVANGGWMPVSPDTLLAAGRTEPWKVGDMTSGTRVAHSKDVILPASETRFELLVDRFQTGLPGRLDIVFSVGDVVLLAGISFLVYRAMTRGHPAQAAP